MAKAFFRSNESIDYCEDCPGLLKHDNRMHSALDHATDGARLWVSLTQSGEQSFRILLCNANQNAAGSLRIINQVQHFAADPVADLNVFADVLAVCLIATGQHPRSSQIERAFKD